MTAPSVAWITPTTAGRSARHAGLWSSFASQDYAATIGGRLMLYVLDDAPTPSPFFARIRDPRLVYLHVPASPASPRRTIGAKRNALVAHALASDLIVHADDDDFYAPSYTREMTQRLFASAGTGAGAGAALARLNVIHLLREADGSRWRWDMRACGGVQCALSGPSTQDVQCRETPCDPSFADLARLGWGFSFVYPRAAALAHPFPDVDAGEDHAFARALERAGGKIVQVDDLAHLAWHVVHPSSTSQAIATERLDAPTPPVIAAPIAPPRTSASERGVPASLHLVPGTPLRITALVKNTHSPSQLLRRAQHLGLVLSEVQDPAPCVMAVPDGYRYVRAAIATARAITLPTRLPAPLSWFDETRIVSLGPLEGSRGAQPLGPLGPSGASGFGPSGPSGYDDTRVIMAASSASSAAAPSAPATSATTGEAVPPEKTDWPTVAWTGAALAGVVGAFWMVLHSAGRPAR